MIQTQLEFRADGDANCYSLFNGKRWIMSIRQNGEMGVPEQVQNMREITAIPGLLQAAMRGHGWGDPLHQQAHPNCTMCAAIRQAIGPLTRERVIELAKMDPDYVSEMIFDDRWEDVWIHLGVAMNVLDGNRDNNPDTIRRYMDGEYDGLDAELIKVLPTL